MSSLFHITQQEAWEQAQTQGMYTAPSLATEGFIHLSEQAQVVGTANRFYQGHLGLVLLEINRDRLQSRLQYDAVPGHGLFPHLYGPLNLDAVVQVVALTPNSHGRFESVDSNPMQSS